MMKAVAQNGLTDSAAKRFFVKGTAYTDVYNPTTHTWSQQANRNPVWAACDLMRASYGGGYSDAYLDLDNLAAWAQWCDDNEVYFDYCFDSKSDIYSQIAVCLRVMRAVPVFPLNKLRLIRDEPVEIPTLVFTKENILNDSFQLQYKGVTDDDYDGYKLSYTDETTDDTETVTCVLNGYAGVKLKSMTIPGITNRERAYRQGMYELSVELENRASISFDTNLTGWTGLPGDVAYVNYPIFGGNTSGCIKAISGTTIQLDCNVNLNSTYPNILKIRSQLDGSILGTYTVHYAEAGNYNMLELDSAPDTTGMVFSDPQALPIFILGVENSLAKKVRISSAQKKASGMSFEVYIDTDARFSYEASTPSTPLPNTADPTTPVNGDTILDFDASYGIDGPMLFAWDSSENQYVSSHDGNKVFKIDSTGVPSVFASDISGARNMAIDASDNVYVAANGVFKIYKITPSGTKSVFASDVGSVYDMKFDDSWNLIVSSNTNNCVYKIAPDGTKTTIASGITGASGLLWSSDKTYIYCGGMYDGCVHKINASTGAMTTFASGLGEVCNIVFDSDGNMLVSRYYTSGTDLTGIWKITPAGVVSIYANIKSAHEMTIDADNILYVSSYLDGKVYTVNPAGTIGTLATAIGGPYGIAFNPDGVLWIAGYTADAMYSIVPNYVPVAPTDVTIEPYDAAADGTPEGMTISWTSDGVARRFMVQYSLDYGATWITAASSATGTSFVVDSYEVGTVYARVAAVYNGTIWDYGYSGPTYMPASTNGFIYVTSDNYIDVTTDNYKYVSQGEG
jgi:sugar lactone lactonase YvrE